MLMDTDQKASLVAFLTFFQFPGRKRESGAAPRGRLRRHLRDRALDHREPRPLRHQRQEQQESRLREDPGARL